MKKTIIILLLVVSLVLVGCGQTQVKDCGLIKYTDEKYPKIIEGMACIQDAMVDCEPSKLTIEYDDEDGERKQIVQVIESEGDLCVISFSYSSNSILCKLPKGSSFGKITPGNKDCEIVCDKPHIKIKDECCLDKNEDNICDCDKPYIKVESKCCLDENENDMCDYNEPTSFCTLPAGLECTNPGSGIRLGGMTIKNVLGYDINYVFVGIKDEEYIRCTGPIELKNGEEANYMCRHDHSLGTTFKSELIVDFKKTTSDEPHTKVGEIILKVT